MHYFTKEWYELETSAHSGLEKDKQAEAISEEYFQELYKQKFEELLKELQIVHEEIALKYQTLKEGQIKYELVNRKKVAENFYQSCLENQSRIKNTLPEEILKKIADIRIFVLHKATRQVIEEVTQFCQGNIELKMKTIEDYRKYSKEVSKDQDNSVLEEVNFHDRTVVDIEETEKTFFPEFLIGHSFDIHINDELRPFLLWDT
ncbi:hypothetical protein [Desulfosporosinus hippei]|uniref:DUF4085 family protein n=1 Tax=Desulfosporosinus hippei DSM 8344 TaxID=1121419 RepID=A0A1G8L699_9FIRM|nr:hypothetical protein [Desulfosporosinus hippei]SDI51206.1 hypothetical protein SAMN05443529_14514 [Desulfosporosinus hippei DSM 8344]